MLLMTQPEASARERSVRMSLTMFPPALIMPPPPHVARMGHRQEQQDVAWILGRGANQASRSVVSSSSGCLLPGRRSVVAEGPCHANGSAHSLPGCVSIGISGATIIHLNMGVQVASLSVAVCGGERVAPSDLS